MIDSGKSRAMGARLSLMMFLQFFVWGAWFVTAGNYMEEVGLSRSIGWAYSMGPIAAIISPFVLGMAADRFFAVERILGLLHVLGGAALFCAPLVVNQTHAPTLFIGLLLLHTVCYMPTLSLTNTLVFHNITNREKQFPLIRVFGTLGWITAGILVSKILHADKTALPFHVAGAAGVLLGLYSQTLPNTPPPAKGRPVSLRDLLCLDALSLFKQPSFAIFILCSMLICMPLAAYYAFAPVFVDAVHVPDPAFKLSFGQMSEIVFMLVMPLFFARLGVKKMLLIGMSAWAVRYGLFALAAPQQTVWMILIGIALHGICYDFFFVTGQIYVDKVSPAAIRGQAQGLLVQMTLGWGMLIGAQLSAKLYARLFAAPQADALVGWRTYWMIPALTAVVILVIFAMTFRYREENTEGIAVGK